MDEFTIAKGELEEVLKRLQAVVQRVVEADTPAGKRNIEREARPIMREARTALAALRTEARNTTDPLVRTKHDTICRECDERIRIFDNEIKTQLYAERHVAGPKQPRTFEEMREQELLGAGGPDGNGFTSAGQVLDTAVNVQQDAIASLQRTERLMNTTEEQGTATLQQLQRQTEQMYKIDEELDNLQGQLDHAARDVKWFYRQLTGDKCFLALFGICILALLALVFVAIWTKRKKK